MTTIVLQQFGGMAPSANPKTLPDSKSVEAHNLNLRFGDFRPVAAPVNVTTATAGKTLYKFNKATTFLTNTNDVSYVRGPIANDSTERTYYTGDGVPKVTDLTLAIRQLGVPAPATAPAYTVNVVDEFTPEESTAAQSQALLDMLTIITNDKVWAYTGLDNSELAGEFVATDRPWEFAYVIPGTVVSGVFTPTNPSHNNLMDARFGFYMETTGGTTVAKVPFFLRAATVSFASSLAADLNALKNPETGADLLTLDKRNQIVSVLNDYLKPADKVRDDAIERMRKLKVELTTLAGSTQTLIDADITAVKNFYARTEVATAISDAKTRAANAIANAVTTYNTVGL